MAWQSLGLTDEDLAKLQARIVEYPDCGRVIAGTGGLRKLRLAPEGRGKSGGCRVCYACFPAYGTAILALVYGKSAKSELSPAEKNSIARLLRQIALELAERNED